MLELFPEGFEERETEDGLELAAYTDAGGEERLWAAFGTVSGRDVPTGWEERWREFHRPIRVGRLWIGPPWEQPPAGVTAIAIDPGRAFGTGGHPTTRLSLKLLLEVEPGSLLDIGCGSGVIAIASAQLGFAPVVAVDHDAAAIEATERNAAANGVSVDVRLADALAEGLPRAETTVANVSAPFTRRLGSDLRSTFLIASGYLVSEEVRPAGFRRELRRVENGWAADLFRREE
jgi:ribosomal protein L11 methyltransferase